MITREDFVYSQDWEIFTETVEFKRGACFKTTVEFMGGLKIHEAFYAPHCIARPTSIQLKVGDTWHKAKNFITVALGNVLCTVYDTQLLHVDCNVLQVTMPYCKVMPKLKEMSREYSELARSAKNILLMRRK